MPPGPPPSQPERIADLRQALFALGEGRLMRCLCIVLAWTFGVPHGLALLLSAIFAWLFACVWAAQLIGLPDYVGMAVGMLFVFLGMGAWFGIQECREGW